MMLLMMMIAMVDGESGGVGQRVRSRKKRERSVSLLFYRKPEDVAGGGVLCLLFIAHLRRTNDRNKKVAGWNMMKKEMFMFLGLRVSKSQLSFRVSQTPLHV
ncbi:hypothetical protein HanIR_Chr05g0212621 [Helianthus annuus]|nr:hypothetical protein HanIR_Chr05g0212621 [Helianthus annuus]